MVPTQPNEDEGVHFIQVSFFLWNSDPNTLLLEHFSFSKTTLLGCTHMLSFIPYRFACVDILWKPGEVMVMDLASVTPGLFVISWWDCGSHCCSTCIARTRHSGNRKPDIPSGSSGWVVTNEQGPRCWDTNPTLVDREAVKPKKS